MEILILFAVLMLVAVVAPLFGTDSRDGRPAWPALDPRDEAQRLLRF